MAPYLSKVLRNIFGICSSSHCRYSFAYRKQHRKKIVHVERRYVKLKKVFSAFAQGAGYFSDPKCEIKGVDVAVSDNGEYFDATFATLQGRFNFTVCYAEDNSLRGKVIFILQAPSFSDIKKIIGTFTFNVQGETDFEVAEGCDKIELNYSSDEIVQHFLDQAIQQQ